MWTKRVVAGDFCTIAHRDADSNGGAWSTVKNIVAGNPKCAYHGCSAPCSVDLNGNFLSVLPQQNTSTVDY